MRFLFFALITAVIIAYMKASDANIKTLTSGIESVTYALTGRNNAGTFAEYPVVVDSYIEPAQDYVFDMPNDEVIR